MRVEEQLEQSLDLAPMLAGQRAPGSCHEVDTGEDDEDDSDDGDDAEEINDVTQDNICL